MIRCDVLGHRDLTYVCQHCAHALGDGWVEVRDLEATARAWVKAPRRQKRTRAEALEEARRTA